MLQNGWRGSQCVGHCLPYTRLCSKSILHSNSMYVSMQCVQKCQNELYSNDRKRIACVRKKQPFFWVCCWHYFNRKKPLLSICEIELPLSHSLIDRHRCNGWSCGLRHKLKRHEGDTALVRLASKVVAKTINCCWIKQQNRHVSCFINKDFVWFQTPYFVCSVCVMTDREIKFSA